MPGLSHFQHLLRYALVGPEDGANRERTRHRLTLLAVVAAHVLLVALLLLAWPAPVAAPQADELQLFTLSDTTGAPASAPAAKRAPTAVPEPKPAPAVIPVPLPPSVGGSVAGSSAGATGATEGGCAIAATVASAIASDPAAVATLQALPPEARTRADAVLLWNGEWLRVPLPDGTDALVGIRAIVEGVFAQSPPGCVASEIPGPQFVPVPVGDRTIMLVVGSGKWRWSDLIEPMTNALEPNSYGAIPKPDASNDIRVQK